MSPFLRQVQAARDAEQLQRVIGTRFEELPAEHRGEARVVALCRHCRERLRGRVEKRDGAHRSCVRASLRARVRAVEARRAPALRGDD